MFWIPYYIKIQYLGRIDTKLLQVFPNRFYKVLSLDDIIGTWVWLANKTFYMTGELLFINWRTTNNFFKAGSFLSVLVTPDKRYWCFATSSQLSLRKLFLVLLVFKGWRFLKVEVKNFRTLWVMSTLYKTPALVYCLAAPVRYIYCIRYIYDTVKSV